MYIESFSDPEEWLAAVTPYLLEHEAQHNLMFGLTRVMIDNPGIYAQYSLAAVKDADGQVIGAVMRTPPHAALISHLAHPDTLDLVIADLAQRYPDLPSVNSRDDQARAFAERWTALYGGTPKLDMPQRIYQLEKVILPQDIPGDFRSAGVNDTARLADWYADFLVDARLHKTKDSGIGYRWAMVTVTTRTRRVFFWEVHGVPVSMIGVTGPTPNGIRIGPVYTPIEFRGRGYASMATASISQMLLDEGRKFCFLYTDLDNPTSNKIYQQIGYTPVCDTSIYLLS